LIALPFFEGHVMTKQPRLGTGRSKTFLAETVQIPPDQSSNTSLDGARAETSDDPDERSPIDTRTGEPGAVPSTPVPIELPPGDQPKAEDGDDNAEGKPTLNDTGAKPPDEPQPVDHPTLILIRKEIQRAIDMKPTDPREFGFKVNTVKWFGLLCAIVVMLLIVLDFVFIDKIITASGPPSPQMNLAAVLGAEPPVSERLLQLGIENEALALRNKRTVGALYMRAYTQFLSITAGAILAMLGAIFVLARVDSRETRSEASLLEFRWLINTASPGILLAGLGVILVGYVAYLSISEIRTTDLPVFSPIVAGTAGGSTLTGYLNSDAFQKQMDEDLGRTKSED
jgi:hypothetical protein